MNSSSASAAAPAERGMGPAGTDSGRLGASAMLLMGGASPFTGVTGGWRGGKSSSEADDTNHHYKDCSRYGDRDLPAAAHENTLAPRANQPEGSIPHPGCFRQPGAGVVASLIVPGPQREQLHAAGTIHLALALRGLRRRSSQHNAVSEGRRFAASGVRLVGATDEDTATCPHTGARA